MKILKYHRYSSLWFLINEEEILMHQIGYGHLIIKGSLHAGTVADLQVNQK